MRPEARRHAVFHPEFRDDLRYWVKSDRSTALRILDLVEAALRNPFEGVGKPEPLRYVLAGCWSRRIDSEHRLVYEITDNTLKVIGRRFHY